MKREFSSKVTGSRSSGDSIVLAQDYLNNRDEFLEIRQTFTSYWSPQQRSEQELVTQGGYLAPVDKDRDWKFFLDENYRFYLLCRDGSPVAFLDGFIPRMPHLKSDPEFPKGTEHFIESFSSWPYNFSGNFAYLYYMLKLNIQMSPQGLLALHQRFLDDMTELGASCVVTDLPRRIRGAELTLPRVTKLAIRQGWQPMPKWVADEAGNIWQQYVQVLNGKPVTLEQRVQEEGFDWENFMDSGAWQGIEEACAFDLPVAETLVREFRESPAQQRELKASIMEVAA